MSDFFEHPEFLRQMNCLLAHVDKNTHQCPCPMKSKYGVDEYECQFSTMEKCTRHAKRMVRLQLRDAIFIYEKYKE